MINFSALINSLPIKSRSNLLVTDLIFPDQHKNLIDQFPVLNFSEIKRDETHYDVSKEMTFKFETSAEVFNKQTLFTSTLSPLWKNFLNSVTSNDYITLLSSIAGVNLSDKKWHIEFARYRHGDWLDAHYDRQANKVLTQLFYFNQHWDVSWGGYLHILDPNNIETTLCSIPPTINYSIILVANSDAWHRVSKVQVHAQKNRYVMGLEFYKET